MRRLLEAVSYSHLFTALSLGVYSLGVQVAFVDQVVEGYSLLVFFAAWLVYATYHYIGCEFVPPSHLRRRTKWIRSNRVIMQLIIAVNIIGVGLMVFILSKDYINRLLPCLFALVAYAIPALKFGTKRYKLRDFPGLKILLVTATVLYILVMVPIWENTNQVLLFLFSQWFLLLSVTLPFDIRDVNYDRRFDLFTLPAALGEQNAWRIAMVMAAVATCIGSIAWEVWSLPAIAAGMVALIAVACARRLKSVAYTHLILDLPLLLQGLLLLAVPWGDRLVL